MTLKLVMAFVHQPLQVNEGTNLTADSFYSSQGRADSAFNDENSQLIGEVLDRYPKAITMDTWKCSAR